MTSLKLPCGSITTDPAKMRKIAVGFYSELFSAETCNAASTEELPHGIPQNKKNL